MSLALCFAQFSIAVDKLLECCAKVLHRLQCGMGGYLEQLYQRVDVGRLVVEGGCCKEQHLVTDTEIVKQSIIQGVFVAETMCLVEDDKELFVGLLQFLIM